MRNIILDIIMSYAALVAEVEDMEVNRRAVCVSIVEYVLY